MLTCAEIDDQIEQEDGIGDAVEYDPVQAQVIAEEGDPDGQDDEVGDQQDQHEQVPVESGWLKLKRK